MSQVESIVVYDGLPIASGGAHAVNRLSALETYQAWLRFLDACTEQVGFDALLRVDRRVQPSTEAGVRDLLPDLGSSISGVHELKEDQVEVAFALLAAISPQPVDAGGMAAVSLHIEAPFLLRHPEGGLWPAQDRALFGHFETPTGVKLGVSSARIAVMPNRSFGLMLTVPSATDAHLSVLRPWLQGHLPFKFSSRHWVQWTLNKNGRTYRAKRLTTK